MSEQERIEKLKELINRIADSYAEPSEEAVRVLYIFSFYGIL